MDIKLTEEEQSKYDNVYSQITGKYNKEDLELLENDDVAKFVLKNLIVRYVLTGEMPTDFSVNYNTHLGMSNEVHYDASIPLQNPEEVVLVENVKTISNEVKVDLDDIISSLEIERTESDELDNSIQDK
jgi:hypothetical protein